MVVSKNVQMKALSERNGDLDRIDAVRAEVYWRELKIKILEDELNDFKSERDRLQTEHNTLVSKHQLGSPTIDEWMAICEKRAPDKISVAEMVQTLLWERWHEGMTSAEIIRDINLRWGRFQEIKEGTIRKCLTRLQKADKGYYTAGVVELNDGVYEHWDKPFEYWPGECTYKPELCKLQGRLEDETADTQQPS